MSSRITILVAALIAFTTGCTKHVTAEPVRYALADSEPTHGAVHPYSPDHDRVPEKQVAVLFLLTEVDLGTLAGQWDQFLYYDLLPCSSDSKGYDLFTGDVFVATDQERSTVLEPDGASKASLYKVHIPLDLARIVSQARITGGMDVAAELEEARQHGLCVRLGSGGQMGMWVLSSNLVEAPLSLVDETLVIDTNLKEL